MASLIYIVGILLVLCQCVQNHFHLYYMDRTNSSDLYNDCLYYKVDDKVIEPISTDYNTKKFYQIIPYCIRPFSKLEQMNNEMMKGNISSRITFEELRKKEVTIHDLLSWSASIDLIERYDEYMNFPSNVSLRFEIFYNCSSSWFGPFCRYTFNTYPIFNTSLPFNIIVNKTFTDNRFSTISNMTCYLYLQCDRGPSPACFDWREICDGKVDCMGNDLDEMNCFELEMNECEENEFRCRNGMCIPEEFLDEGLYFPDCLDGTDEDHRWIGFNLVGVVALKCSIDPGFWCEETDFVKPSRFFVCGDGQHSDESILNIIVPWSKLPCKNLRDMITKKSLLSYIEHPDLSYDCWFLLQCSTTEYNELDCKSLCEDNNILGCNITITDICRTNFVIFPQRPIFQGHVQLIYLTNKTILFIEEEISMFPDYVCYDVRKCPFLPSISILNISGTTCRSTKEFGLHSFDDILYFFQACLIVIDINYSQSSLIQCPGTTKYISKDRVVDGVPDCYNGVDEMNIDTCQWNDKHRFKCSSENKCLSHFLVRNSMKDCHGGEDELSNILKEIVYQKLCNGYEHLSSILIDGLNETDETHCDDWPCNNFYTRCDGAWHCPNGIDEMNCEPTKCSLDTHECVSPLTKKVMCLPLSQAGNGIVDCLGATDERGHCRLLLPDNTKSHYRCLNETFCSDNFAICNDNLCFNEDMIECSEDIKRVFDRLVEDRKLQYPDNEYFILERFDKKTFDSNSINDLDPFSHLLKKKFNVLQTETCHRGILIYVGSEFKIYCLCPPSYFGDRCQYQSERVSLTVEFSRLCSPSCEGIFGIIINLIDEDNIIYDSDQLTYTSTYKCQKKYFIYLLYKTRPKDLTKSYYIKIDVYNKVNITYYATWIFPVQFIFLPVNKISAHLFIPAYPVSIVGNCSRFCGHGECFTYINKPNQYFCHCHSNWSGINCTISHNCDCSSDSSCLGHINHRSICLCNLENYGPKCRIPSICQNGTCKNGGLCIPDDERVSRNSFLCVCPSGYSGTTCELVASEIHISFNGMEIPRSLRVHFLSVQRQSDPMRTTVSTKIPFDRDIAIIRISISFHIIIIQMINEYFLAYVNANYTYSSLSKISIERNQQCPHVEQLFNNKSISTYSLLRRVKYYHLLCQNHSELKCFHDNEEYMCLCNEERYANCFPFNYNIKYNCQKYGDCQNEGECLMDRPNCPNSIFCVCTDCFYGSKCQFTTKGSGLSLDAILGYQIRPHLSVNRQPFIVKLSIGLTVIMFIIGLINSILSIITFRREKSSESGCREYLLSTSIGSFCATIIFSMKLLILILSQMSLITNMTVLHVSCKSIDFFLRLGPIIIDWINASVALDRLLTVVMGVRFNKKKSKRSVRWVIIGIVLISVCSILHDPIHEEAIYDQEEDRRWCLIQYSSSLKIYNSIINIIHFVIPFVINLLTGIIIIIVAARRRFKARQKPTYREALNEQFRQHKHLIISSIILVILSTPRLVISFISGCMKSARDPAFYLAGYFISFIPPSLTFIVFVIPSKIYRKDFCMAINKFRNNIK